MRHFWYAVSVAFYPLYLRHWHSRGMTRAYIWLCRRWLAKGKGAGS